MSWLLMLGVNVAGAFQAKWYGPSQDLRPKNEEVTTR